MKRMKTSESHNHGQWNMNHGPWTMDYELRTMDYVSACLAWAWVGTRVVSGGGWGKSGDLAGDLEGVGRRDRQWGGESQPL